MLGSPEHGVKASLRSPLMLPRVAVVDPDLLAGLPPAVLAASGLDALSQLIEPFLSIRANPVTDALARDGIRALGAALPRAYAAARAGDADRRRDREALALASLFGGLCLANAGLGAVHGFAAPARAACSQRRTAPSARRCCRHVLRVNVRALAARAPEQPRAARASASSPRC